MLASDNWRYLASSALPLLIAATPCCFARWLPSYRDRRAGSYGADDTVLRVLSVRFSKGFDLIQKYQESIKFNNFYSNALVKTYFQYASIVESCIQNGYIAIQ